MCVVVASVRPSVDRQLDEEPVVLLVIGGVVRVDIDESGDERAELASAVTGGELDGRRALDQRVHERVQETIPPGSIDDDVTGVAFAQRGGHTSHLPARYQEPEGSLPVK